MGHGHENEANPSTSGCHKQLPLSLPECQLHNLAIIKYKYIYKERITLQNGKGAVLCNKNDLSRSRQRWPNQIQISVIAPRSEWHQSSPWLFLTKDLKKMRRVQPCLV